MDVTEIPDAFPPAITISRETAVFCLSYDLEKYDADGPVAQARRWALTGDGPTPIARQAGTRGRPATPCSSTRADGPTATAGRTTRDEKRSSAPASSCGG